MPCIGFLKVLSSMALLYQTVAYCSCTAFLLYSPQFSDISWKESLRPLNRTFTSSTTWPECLLISLFITLALMNTFSSIFTIYLLKDFEEITMTDEIKDKLMKSLGSMSISMDTLFSINVVLFFLNIFLLTHQTFWHTLLDSSWCNNNIFKDIKPRATIIE